MKSREFIRDYLLPAGATLEKTDGDHHVYRLPNGTRMDVPMGGSHTEAPRYLVARFKRRMQGRGGRR